MRPAADWCRGSGYRPQLSGLVDQSIGIGFLAPALVSRLGCRPVPMRGGLPDRKSVGIDFEHGVDGGGKDLLEVDAPMTCRPGRSRPPAAGGYRPHPDRRSDRTRRSRTWC